MAKRKYGNKKDANHKEIVDAFEALGASVLDLSDMGCGVPDLIVWCMHGWQMVDVKYVAPLARPVTLAEMRAEPRLVGMALLKRGQRLSVQPVMPHEWKIILQLSKA